MGIVEIELVGAHTHCVFDAYASVGVVAEIEYGRSAVADATACAVIYIHRG